MSSFSYFKDAFSGKIYKQKELLEDNIAKILAKKREKSDVSSFSIFLQLLSLTLIKVR